MIFGAVLAFIAALYFWTPISRTNAFLERVHRDTAAWRSPGRLFR
jgi:hypothetical protein